MSRSIVAKLPGIDRRFKLKERKDLEEGMRRLNILVNMMEKSEDLEVLTK